MQNQIPRQILYCQIFSYKLRIQILDTFRESVFVSLNKLNFISHSGLEGCERKRRPSEDENQKMTREKREPYQSIDGYKIPLWISSSVMYEARL